MRGAPPQGALQDDSNCTPLLFHCMEIEFRKCNGRISMRFVILAPYYTSIFPTFSSTHQPFSGLRLVNENAVLEVSLRTLCLIR